MSIKRILLFKVLSLTTKSFPLCQVIELDKTFEAPPSVPVHTVHAQAPIPTPSTPKTYSRVKATMNVVANHSSQLQDLTSCLQAQEAHLNQLMNLSSQLSSSTVDSSLDDSVHSVDSTGTAAYEDFLKAGSQQT